MEAIRKSGKELGKVVIEKGQVTGQVQLANKDHVWGQVKVIGRAKTGL